MNKLLLVFVIMAGLVMPFSLRGYIHETGSFRNFLMGSEPGCQYDNWLTHISEGIAYPGYNAYPPWDRQTNGFGAFTLPDSLLSWQWSVVDSFFVNQQWEDVDNALAEYNINYSLVRLDDSDTGRTYYMLRENLSHDYRDDNGTESTADDEEGSFDLGWGLVVFNPEALSSIVIMVPHPNDDYIAIPLAWRAFTQYNARYLMINGAGREVCWDSIGVYNNSHAISDPSRYAGHPLHNTYKRSCNEIRALLANMGSIIPREFSMQTHSYDTNLHIGFANCQVSAGNGQICPNLPIRDLALTRNDLIHNAGYVIHQPNTIGIHDAVLTNNFFAVNYSYHPFVFNDGEHQVTVSNNVDLPGYGANNQMLYSIDGWNSFDVYDPFFHIEMDELPDCYPQTNEALAWFYGYDAATQTWNLVNRYSKVLAYYQPWVDALQSSLNTTLLMDDYAPPQTPVITSSNLLYSSYAQLNWNRLYEYDFHTWKIAVERLTYLGNGNYTVEDTTFYDRDDFPELADQATTSVGIGLQLGWHYRIRLAAVDKSNRISDYTPPVYFVTYSINPVVSNLQFRKTLTDNDQIGISWNPIPSTILIAGYRIERRYPGATNWEAIVTLPQAASSYIDGSFSYPDSLVYQYRVVTLGYSGQVFTPTTFCTGYFRAYPAPIVTSIEHLPDGQIELNWNAVTQTLSGNADTPDYYLVQKSSAPDFSGQEPQNSVSVDTQYLDNYTPGSEWEYKAFYRIRAMATQLP
jgi:hypothetical protein